MGPPPQLQDPDAAGSMNSSLVTSHGLSELHLAGSCVPRFGKHPVYGSDINVILLMGSGW